jgi:phage terminase large subunit-like protein
MKLENLSDEELLTIASGLKKGLDYRRMHRLEFWVPYKKQQEFFDLGADKRERLFQAGNQLFGKTTAGAVETTYHLTGIYPPNWTGRRWDRPTKGWACGESMGWTRDQAQSRLCGPHTTAFGKDALDWGTGFIPKELLIDRTLSHGVQNAFDSITVRHITGGDSYLGFKGYEQGRNKFQGASLDFIWPDECPPDDIYSECMARLAATNGIIFTTFTPMLGSTGVTDRFWNDDSAQAKKDRGVVKVGIVDVEGKTQAEIDSVIGSYEPHEMQARINGEIMMGEGAVFEGINEDMISYPAIEIGKIPLWWRKIWAIDFGIGHPFAAVLLGHDPDRDIIFVIHEIKIQDALPQHHIAMMRGIAPEPPVAWPHDGAAREKSSGMELHDFYRERKGQPGMRMRNSFATMPQGGYSTSAGITEILTRMRQGKFLVFDTCQKWFHEFRSYHRKNGLIVKINDDLLSATRQGVMDIRYAKEVPLGPLPGGFHPSQRIRQLAETDPFSNQPI